VGGVGATGFKAEIAVVLPGCKSVCEEREGGMVCLRIHSGPKFMVVVAILSRCVFELENGSRESSSYRRGLHDFQVFSRTPASSSWDPP
jgi:hypothetical protein